MMVFLKAHGDMGAASKEKLTRWDIFKFSQEMKSAFSSLDNKAALAQSSGAGWRQCLRCVAQALSLKIVP